MLMDGESAYRKLLLAVRKKGEVRGDRTGTGTRSLFGRSIKIDNSGNRGFPLLTSKKVNFAAVVKELDWFLSGSTNTNDLGCGIWDEWADENGDLGPVYGSQWRSWGSRGIDQIQQAYDALAEDPTSRRIVISAWNAEDIPAMALAPCHMFIQFYARKNKVLEMAVYQRSADMMLGVPFNIASYALLHRVMAHETGMSPGAYIHHFGDAHIYSNHEKGADTLLRRTSVTPPKLVMTQEQRTDLLKVDLRVDKRKKGRSLPYYVGLQGYDPAPAIRLPVAV